MDRERIGRGIKILRKKAGFNQKELANKLFVSDMAVSKWENGKSIPDVDILKRLAVILDMDIDGILDGAAASLDAKWCAVLFADGNDVLGTVILDKPVIDYVLSYFLLVGVRHILVVGQDKSLQIVRDRFNDGTLLGISIQYYNSSLLRIRDLPIRNQNVVLITDPFFIFGVNLTRFMQRCMRHNNTVVQLAISNKAVNSICSICPNDYEVIPIFFFNGNVWEKYKNEGTIEKIVESAKENDSYFIETLDFGFVFSLFSTNQIAIIDFVKATQAIDGHLLYCPFEIAYKRDILKTLDLQMINDEFSEYAAYLQRMFSCDI